MNRIEPPDYAPLSFGAGLALGLLLIVALPAERERPATTKNEQPAVEPAGTNAHTWGR